MTPFYWGACAMACAVIALFFLKFYRRSTDRLLMMFSLAFATLSVHWLCLGIVQPPEETRHYFYVIRLFAFLLILAAIVDKNRAARRATPPSK